MEQTESFTEGPIFPRLLRFAAPVLLALFLQAMYGAVDLLVVGQFGGARAEEFVSAVSTGSQLMQTVTIVLSGLAMGLTVYVAQTIGAGQGVRAGRIIGSGVWLFGLLALVLTLVLTACAPRLSALLRAPEAAFAQTTAYLRICSAGSLFIVAYNLLGSVFRGLGDSKLPLFSVAVACGLNIAGDLLLVAVLGLGAAGAAAATVCAQAVSVLLSLLLLRRRTLPFSFSLRDIRPDAEHIRRIVTLGAPIALQDLLVSISFLVVLALVNRLGLTSSAGVGLAEKVCAFLMLLPSAFMQSMSAFVGQNIGAGKPARARAALLWGIGSSLAAGLLLGAVTYFRGDLLSGLFARDAGIIAASAQYLKAYAIDCVLTSFLFCFIGYFNGCGSTGFVMLQGIIGAFCVRVPVSWRMSLEVPVSLFHMGLATPASTVVQILLCAGYFLYLRGRQEKDSAAKKMARLDGEGHPVPKGAGSAPRN